MTTSVRPRERALAEILQMTQQVLRCNEIKQSRQVAIRHLRKLFDATGAVFVVPGRSVPLGPDDAVVDGTVKDLPSVYGHYLHEDPGLPLLQRARRECRPLVLTSQMFMGGGRLLSTRYYSEVMRPREMHHAMAILLAADRRPQGVIAVYRSHEQKPFGEGDVAAALAAIPVLTTALESVGRIFEAVEQVHHSIAVLDERLDVLYRDTSGAPWLTDWLGGCWQRDDEFARFTGHCRAALAGERIGRETLLSIPTGLGSVARICVEIRLIERPDSARLVLLLRPADGIERSQIRGSALSPREREVARLLATGASHAEVAARLSVSAHTVAHHAGAVYRKTLTGNRTGLAARSTLEPPNPGVVAALTDRERQVVTLLLEGSSNKEMAVVLGLSVSTVSNHLQKIYRKLNVHDRVALIRRL